VKKLSEERPGYVKKPPLVQGGERELGPTTRPNPTNPTNEVKPWTPELSAEKNATLAAMRADRNPQEQNIKASFAMRTANKTDDAQTGQG
jgi:hypothetical protein